MKLAIATPLYPPEIGGPATHAVFLERRLPEYGIEARVVPFSGVKHLPKGIRHAAYLVRVWREARRADAVFAEDTVSAGFPALIAARLARRSFVVRVPGDHAWEQGRQRFGVLDSLDAFQEKRYSWRVELLRTISRCTVRRADRVVVPSRYFEKIVLGWGVSPARLSVIYNGIDAENVPEAPASVPKHPFFVSSGRLVPWKGFLALIDMLDRVPEWSLVIVGDGPMRDALEAAVRARKLEERVLFTGNLSRAQVFGWLRSADAFVLNSSFESFSYQIVEALSAGVPVIATGIGSIPELITDGVEGALVAPNDQGAIAAALRSVLDEQEAWKERTQTAAEKAVRFSSQTTARQFAELLRALVP